MGANHKRSSEEYLGDLWDSFMKARNWKTKGEKNEKGFY